MAAAKRQIKAVSTLLALVDAGAEGAANSTVETDLARDVETAWAVATPLADNKWVEAAGAVGAVEACRTGSHTLFACVVAQKGSGIADTVPSNQIECRWALCALIALTV